MRESENEGKRRNMLKRRHLWKGKFVFFVFRYMQQKYFAPNCLFIKEKNGGNFPYYILQIYVFCCSKFILVKSNCNFKESCYFKHSVSLILYTLPIF